MERERLEGRLAHTELDAEVCRKLLEAVDRGGIGLALTDAQDRFIYVNEAHARIYGRSREEMLGKTWRDLIPPEQVGSEEAAWARCIEGGEVRHLEIPGILGDGTVGHHQVAGVPQRDAHGAYAGHVCIVQEHHQRVRAAERLRESEERFRELVEGSRDLIWSADEQGRLTYLNPAVERILGISPSEAIGRHYSEFLAPGQEEKAARLFAQVLAGGELMPYELTFRKPSGEEVSLSICARAVLSADGRPLGAQGTARDVTCLKRAEARLALYGDIIAHSSEAIGILDLEGRYVEQNEAHRALLGCSDEELLGQTPAVHFGEEVFARMQRDLEREGRFRAELKARHRSGEWRDIEVSVFLVRNAQNEPVCYVGLKRDITERVRVEAELARHRLHLEEMVEERTSQVREANARLEREVAERKQAEEALRQSEARLKLAQSAADVGTWDWDIEANRVTCSERYFQLYGLPSGSGMPSFEDWLAVVHPEDRERVIQEVQQALEGTGPYGSEYRVVWPDGSVHWLASKGTVIRDEAGRLKRMIGADIDITERKRAEEALAADTRLMEALFEGSHNPLVYFDRGFNFVRVNEAYAQSCRRTKEELLGRNHFEFFPHEANEAIFARVRDTGEPYMALARPFVFPDHPEWGETYWDWRLTPVKDAAGQVEGLVFSLVNVTERVRRLQELELARQRIEELARREEERASWLATILDQLPIGVAIAQAPEGRLVFTNSAAVRLWGRAPVSLSMERYHEAWTFLDAEGRLIPGPQLPLARTVRDGVSFINEEITLVRDDGAQVPLMFNAVPLFEEGRITGGAVVFWDVTAQKEAQRRMEEASRLKDEFLSLASHELKTPVTSIKIYADLATRRPDMMRERFPQLMATLGRQADQLVSLVNDLLDVSRLQLGRMPINLQRLDLSELVHEVCQRSRPTFEGRPLYYPRSEEPLPVEADPLRIEQVLHNLLDNAVKYSPESAAIEVRLARREGTAVIEVSDQGIGITPEAMPHIFERFFKPRTQQAVFGGLGLGLYICKEIVERHGGRIWATSVPNEGSTFYVELPLAGEA